MIVKVSSTGDVAWKHLKEVIKEIIENRETATPRCIKDTFKLDKVKRMEIDE